MSPSHQIQLPVAWLDDESPAIYANQFLFQKIGPSEFILMVGQAVPPPVVGTPEAQKEQMERIPYVGVRTIAKVSLTPERVSELVNLLQMVHDPDDDQKDQGVDG